MSDVLSPPQTSSARRPEALWMRRPRTTASATMKVGSEKRYMEVAAFEAVAEGLHDVAVGRRVRRGGRD